METKYKTNNNVAERLDGYARDLYSRTRETVRGLRRFARDYIQSPSYTLPTSGYNQGGSYEDVRRRSNIIPAYA